MKIPEDIRAKLNEEGQRSFKEIAEKFGVDADELPGMYYDRAGTPIGLGDHAALWGDWSYRCVAETVVGPHRVSTVWLGINYAIFGPAPLIFETMAFNEERGRAWDLQLRYSTEEEAIGGHEEVVAHVEQVTGLTREESQ